VRAPRSRKSAAWPARMPAQKATPAKPPPEAGSARYKPPSGRPNALIKKGSMNRRAAGTAPCQARPTADSATSPRTGRAHSQSAIKNRRRQRAFAKAGNKKIRIAANRALPRRRFAARRHAARHCRGLTATQAEQGKKSGRWPAQLRAEGGPATRRWPKKERARARRDAFARGVDGRRG